MIEIKRGFRRFVEDQPEDACMAEDERAGYQRAKNLAYEIRTCRHLFGHELMRQLLSTTVDPEF